jgi:hypothetical protein
MSEPVMVDRTKLLDDVHNIIRTASISRGAADSSTPEQIIWMTCKVIADNLFDYANGEDSNYRWYPRENVLGDVIKREIRMSKLAAGPKEYALKLVDRAVEEWPA